MMIVFFGQLTNADGLHSSMWCQHLCFDCQIMCLQLLEDSAGIHFQLRIDA